MKKLLLILSAFFLVSCAKTNGNGRWLEIYPDRVAQCWDEPTIGTIDYSESHLNYSESNMVVEIVDDLHERGTGPFYFEGIYNPNQSSGFTGVYIASQGSIDFEIEKIDQGGRVIANVRCLKLDGFNGPMAITIGTAEIAE